MLEQIGSVEQIGKYIAKAKDKNDSFRLMGFGHRVYKSYDPRAAIIRKMCHRVLEKLGQRNDQPLFELALKLEEIALKDEYFVEKNLYPNVDFYSGIIYRALGIPKSMFTVMFAIARTVGWVTHWREMVVRPRDANRPAAPALRRPRQAGLRPGQQALGVEQREHRAARCAAHRSLVDGAQRRVMRAALREHEHLDLLPVALEAKARPLNRRRGVEPVAALAIADRRAVALELAPRRAPARRRTRAARQPT